MTEAGVIPLYQALLGEAWVSVAPAIQIAHPPEMPVERAGRFDITHGCGLLARFLARWSKLPAAGNAVPTQLRVERTGNCEIWHRRFGSFPLDSTQYVQGPGILAERFGRIEFRFKVEARDGGIYFHQTRAFIRIGRCKLPLPAGLGPRVDAQEMPGDSPYQTRVRVTVRLPVVGLLIDYQGQMEPQEPTH